MKLNQSQKAYEDLRNQLLAQNIIPGERLVEKHWSEKLKVNRADIRQAFARLLGEGMLVSGPKGGFFARELTSQQRNELDEVRMILEVSSARLAVNRATESEIDQLAEIVDHMTLMAENGYAMGVFEADVRFHEKLIDLSHNKQLAHLYKSTNLPLSMGMQPSVPRSKQVLMKDASEHKAIVEAIKQKDVDVVIDLLTLAFKFK